MPVPRRSPRFWEEELRNQLEAFNNTHDTSIDVHAVVVDYLVAQRAQPAPQPNRRRRRLQPNPALAVPQQALPAAQVIVPAAQDAPQLLQLQPPPVVPLVDSDNNREGSNNGELEQGDGQDGGEPSNSKYENRTNNININEPASGGDDTHAVHLGETGSTTADEDVSIEESRITSSEIDESHSALLEDVTGDATLVNAIKEGQDALIGNKAAHMDIAKLAEHDISSRGLGKAVEYSIDEQSVGQADILSTQALPRSTADMSADDELDDVPSVAHNPMDVSGVDHASVTGASNGSAVAFCLSAQDLVRNVVDEVLDVDEREFAAPSTINRLSPVCELNDDMDVDGAAPDIDQLSEWADPAHVSSAAVGVVRRVRVSRRLLDRQALLAQADASVSRSAGTERHVATVVTSTPAAVEQENIDDKPGSKAIIARLDSNGHSRIWHIESIDLFFDHLATMSLPDLESIAAEAKKVTVEAGSEEQPWVRVTLREPIIVTEMTPRVRNIKKLSPNDLVILYAIFSPIIDFGTRYVADSILRLSPAAKEVLSIRDDAVPGPAPLPAVIVEGVWEIVGHLGLCDPDLAFEPHSRRLIKAMHAKSAIRQSAVSQAIAMVAEESVDNVHPPPHAVFSASKRKDREEAVEEPRAKKARPAAAQAVMTGESIGVGMGAQTPAASTAIPAIAKEASGSGGKWTITSSSDAVREELLIKAGREALSLVIQRWQDSRGSGGRQVDLMEVNAAMNVLRDIGEKINVPVAAARSARAATMFHSFEKKLATISQIRAAEATSYPGLLSDVQRRARQIHKQYTPARALQH